MICAALLRTNYSSRQIIGSDLTALLDRFRNVCCTLSEAYR
jgi:hypothetical protein